MKNKTFNITAFLLSVLCIGFVAFISFVAMAADEEGTGGMITTLLYPFYKVLEFPCFTLFAKSIIESRNFANYLFAYTGNCIFYGTIIERLFTLKLKK